MASYLHGAVSTNDLMVVVGGVGVTGDTVTQLSVYQYACGQWTDLTALTSGQYGQWKCTNIAATVNVCRPTVVSRNAVIEPRVSLALKHWERNWFIDWSVGRSVCLSISLSVCLSVSLSVCLFIKTCEAGLVYWALCVYWDQFRVYVCMYVCMCKNSSQTTEPICIKIISANRASYADCYRLLRFEIFTKYDEYFNPERAPLLHKHIFATSSATASLTTLMTSQSDVRMRTHAQST